MEKFRTELSEEFCKEKMVEMLSAFDRFCESNDLTYYLSWGTLIGAIRHKGFIPWDDDIDVSMPREDYNRLIQLSGDWDLPYDFLCWEKDAKYPKSYGKLSDRGTVLENLYMENIPDLGLFIDVFPMDDVGVSEENRVHLQKQLIYTEKMLTMASMKKFWPSGSVLKSCVKYLTYKIAKCKGVLYWRDRLVKQIKKAAQDANGTCNYCVCASIVLPKKWFKDAAKTEFEGQLYSAPTDADSFLRYYYGDYMVLPPPELRVSSHDHKVYKRV